MTAGVDPWTQALTGLRLGDYELTRYINGGNFSYVYEGTHVPTGEIVAVKILNPNADSEAVLEFEVEASMLKTLSRSSAVVDWKASDRAEARLQLGGMDVPLRLNYLVLELASGCLEELLIRRESLSWNDRISLWRGVILGTHQMHLKRMVHRDLKASNCLLFIQPKGVVQAKVADLGRGKRLDDQPRFVPQAYLCGRGDLRFAAPEFLWLQGSSMAQAHLASDLYGLGSILFELATGVGLTQVALGPGPNLMRSNMAAAARGEKTDLSVLSSQYSVALDIFADEVPKIIRHEARALLAQLCHPQPEQRWPRRQGARPVPSDGLGWLLRRADILNRRLRAEERSTMPARRQSSAA